MATHVWNDVNIASRLDARREAPMQIGRRFDIEIIVNPNRELYVRESRGRERRSMRPWLDHPGVSLITQVMVPPHGMKRTSWAVVPCSRNRS